MTDSVAAPPPPLTPVPSWLSTPGRKYAVVATVVGLGVFFDQWTKVWAREVLKPLGWVEVIPGFLNWAFATNKGAAGSFLANLPDAWRVEFFLVTSTIAMLILGRFLMLTPGWAPRLVLALSLILSGAFGNFICRARFGEVTDFIDVHLGFWPAAYELVTHYVRTAHWPTFNLADAYITVGVGMLVVEMFWGDERAVAAMMGAKADDGPPPAAEASTALPGADSAPHDTSIDSPPSGNAKNKAAAAPPLSDVHQAAPATASPTVSDFAATTGQSGGAHRKAGGKPQGRKKKSR